MCVCKVMEVVESVCVCKVMEVVERVSCVCVR